MANTYTIVITRSFGSLGRPIARKLSEILNIEYYDRDIVDETSKNLGLPVSVVSDEEETAKSGFLNMIYPLGSGTTIQQDKIFDEQAKIIRNLAEKASCIIVGRCADYILENEKNCMRVYISAAYEDRLRNCIDVLGMTPENGKKMIAKVDKARESYHQHYAGYQPSDIGHQDLIINSSMLGINGTAQCLAAIAKERFHLD
nr:cytidylate kinase-like family protein [uncultured Mediterraneibacter sp.]